MPHASQDKQKKASGTHRLTVWSRQTMHWYCNYCSCYGNECTVGYSCTQTRVGNISAFFHEWVHLYDFFGGWPVFTSSSPYLTSPLQVPQDDWSGFSPLGKDDEIPCRRMRSGSYIKAMAEEDSGDSDCSPKPSPKVQARRASYLKATQPSITEMTTLKWVCAETNIFCVNHSR